jgi:putative ABC transport system ATP-binding protein
MMENKSVVSASSLDKVYESGDIRVEVLKNLELEVKESEFMVICGSSGSGKTTLLNIIGGIDKPTRGKIVVFGQDLGASNENSLASFRCNTIGFVFQTYNLVSTLTVAENVAFPMEWGRKSESYIVKRVEELLNLVSLQHRMEHFPFQLSGGEQQRVAFARALANDPPLLLADEPTGNLDTETSKRVIQILVELKSQRKTIIVATHDEQISSLAHRKLCLENGRLTS